MDERCEQAEEASRRDGWPRILAPGEATGGRVALIEVREQRGAGSLRHLHSVEDEIVYILTGQVSFEVGGVARECAAGACLILPRGVEHAYRIESDEARLLVIARPAGIEGYYQELARIAAHPAAADRVERLVSVAARYGIAITGPELQTGRSPRPPPATRN